MTVTILVSLGGGGGTDVLNKFLDTVTVDASTPAIWPMITDTYVDVATDVSASTILVQADTLANMGLALLATIDGWWHCPTYSGSGNLLNGGTGGAGLDMVLGASTAAPTFTTDHFTFDGVNDYMQCADSALLDPSGNNGSFSFFMVCIPLTSIVANARLMSKEINETTPGWDLRSAASGSTLTAQQWDSATRVATGPVMVVGTKALHAGVRNRRTANVITAYRSAGGTLTAGTGVALAGTTTVDSIIDTTYALTLGAQSTASPGLFTNMDMYGAGVSSRPFSTQDLLAIAAAYGV